MATFNQAYDFTVMTGGNSYNLQPGSPATAATVWRVYCVSAGTITVWSYGSNTQATLPMAQGSVLDMMIGSASVASGGFLGIKTSWQPEWNGSQSQNSA